MLNCKRARAHSTDEVQTNSHALDKTTCMCCLFCGEAGSLNKKREWDVRKIQTKKAQDTLLSICSERQDDWASQVRSGIQIGAVYHPTCSSNFRTGKGVPRNRVDAGGDQKRRRMTSPPRKRFVQGGRPGDSERLEAFKRVSMYLESCSEPVTVAKLMDIMRETPPCGEHAVEPYTSKYMLDMLSKHYGEDLVISKSAGMPNILMLHSRNGPFIREHGQDDAVTRAAKIIRDDILAESSSPKDTYPTAEDISSLQSNLDYLPATLRTFLQTLASSRDTDVNLAVASIGQAIMQLCAPRSFISPLQLGLGVQMHAQYGSKALVDSLNHLGFSVSYKEVKLFETSAAIAKHDTLPDDLAGSFLHFVADNADHNSATLDGKGTFHGMGIIACAAPGRRETRPIPRQRTKLADVVGVNRIPIYFHSTSKGSLKNTFFEHTGTLAPKDDTSGANLLWKTSWLIRPNRASWLGWMRTAHPSGAHPGKSSVHFLPLIDMKSTDPACILSTLQYICSQAKRNGVAPVVTFDQPLWLKAKEIVTDGAADSDIKSVVLILGGFHMRMNYIGSIGYLMDGSGLRDAFKLVFAENATDQIMSGKAHARAVRAHCLMTTALHAHLMSVAYGIDQKHPDIAELGELHDLLQNGVLPAEKLHQKTVLKRVENRLAEQREERSTSRTAALWTMYIEMVDLLLEFIKAERTGNFQLHLATVRRMLPFFAASGHNNYVRSASIYLQDMLRLPQTAPKLHAEFQAGNFVVRRSDRYWGGLATDLVIEQTMMRSLKAAGGLTRGRGLSESQRTIWTQSMPACSSLKLAMQTLTGSEFMTSEQHKDIRPTSKARDEKDARSLLEFIRLHDPYAPHNTLRSISTGVPADAKVNVDSARELGETILADLSGKNATTSISRKTRAVTLGHQITIDGGEVQIDQHLLFQRLASALETMPNEEIATVLGHYEMNTYPASLYDECGLLLQSKKSELAHFLLRDAEDSTAVPDGATFVLDGGLLLHQVKWQRGVTYRTVVKSYVAHVLRHYQKVVVVFDGYRSGPGTKDMAHMMRSASKSHCSTIQCTPESLTSIPCEKFLCNSENKMQLIQMLTQQLEETGCTVVQANEDADLLIAQTAVSVAQSTPAVVVSYDTDVLVLLLHHLKQTHNPVWLKNRQAVVNVSALQANVGTDICRTILFTHSITGCDTTSRLYGLGKTAAVKKVSDPVFEQLALTFLTPHKTPDEISAAGQLVLTKLYGGGASDSLATLRYKKYRQKIITGRRAVDAMSLPPTPSAAKYHSLRVYWQVQVWAGGEAAKNMRPSAWGWRVKNEIMWPVYSDQAAAPPNLLHVIRCMCVHGCATKKMFMPTTRPGVFSLLRLQQRWCWMYKRNCDQRGR